MLDRTDRSPRYRPRRCLDSWMFTEVEVLRTYWPDVGLIRQHLPYRTERALRGMAKKCGLIPDKEQHIWTCAEQKRLKQMAAEGTTRKEMAADLGLTVEQVANRLLYCGIHVAKKPPILIGDPLTDAVRRRLFDMKMSIADFDRSFGRRRLFGQHKPKSANVIAKAVKALGGNLTIEWPEE